MTLVQVATSPEAVAVYSLVVAGLEKKFQFIKPAVKYLKEGTAFLKPIEQEGEKLAGEVLDTPKMVALDRKSVV